MSPHSSVLPVRPSISYLKDQAKHLRKAHATGDRQAVQRVRAHHPSLGQADTAGVEFSLRDAQLVVARERGFDNWTELKRHVQDRQNVSTATDIPLTPVSVSQTVPFFAVSAMQTALRHYEGQGFTIKNKWEPDGELRWCWLERDGAALMMQQYHEQGRNARVFDGPRGGGAVFACIPFDPAPPGEAWPLAGLTATTDSDGYTLLQPETRPPAVTGAATRVVPLLSVSDLARSITFYTDGLGFELVARFEQADACWLQRDEVVVALQQESAAPERRGQGVSIFHLCDDAVSLFREFCVRQVSPSEPTVGNRMWVTGVRDPDGYRLSFESPTDAEEEKTLSAVEAEGVER
ncbi:MAG: hypothetical protein HN712_00410 [Gemmatimonadetes bacterium]|jgi:lactoylglutathione lyase|nr:hypothetical protein [Gemmatimonadota bacterium]